MSMQLNRTDFDALENMLIASGVVSAPFEAKTFLESAVASSPRALDLVSSINLGGNPRNTASAIVNGFSRFGKDMPGRESLLLVIDQLKRNVGDDQQRWLNDLAWRYSLSSSFLASKTDNSSEFERIVRGANLFLDVAAWRAKLEALEGQVCRILAPCISDNQVKDCCGTGFLLGPDLVLTNWHVVCDVIAQPDLAHRIKLEFDYKNDAPSAHVKPESFTLAPGKWLVDYSPNGADDPTKLDYALLRLSGRPGDARGWVKEVNPAHNFRVDPALYILQHPSGQPMKLAIDTDAVVEISPNDARVRYRTNTEPGSSGSPCFNQKWELVALHHSGQTGTTPKWNEGIPIKAILALLNTRGIHLPGAVV